MSKTRLFNLLTLGAISLGLVGCGEVVKEEPQHEVIDVVVQTEEEEEIVIEATFPQPYGDDEELKMMLLRSQTATKVDATKLEWFVTIQEETKDLDFDLMTVNSLEGDAWLLFQIDMTRDEYITYSVNSSGKAFEDEHRMKQLSEYYTNALFDLIDTEGYTIYSYENGEPQIEVTDWLGDK